MAQTKTDKSALDKAPAKTALNTNPNLVLLLSAMTSHTNKPSLII